MEIRRRREETNDAGAQFLKKRTSGYTQDRAFARENIYVDIHPKASPPFR